MKEPSLDILGTMGSQDLMEQFGQSSQDSSTVMANQIVNGAVAGVTEGVHTLTLESSKEVNRLSSATPSAPGENRRKWIPRSKSRRKEMKELANLEDSKVTRVGGLIFVPDERFQIALTEETVVLLGLRDDGTEVSIKRMPKSIFVKLQKELEILQELRFKSRHVVQYVDSTSDKNFGYIAMQLCEFNLEEYINQRQPSDSERKRIARELLKGLKDLEEKNVIHQVIKPRNVFIDIDGQVRLADFGMSRILDPGQTTMETRYKRSTDIQMAGMLVHCILSGGKHPFGDDIRCQTNILDGHYTLKDEEAKDLVESMININPKKAPCITEVLKHPYFWEEDRKGMFLEAVGNVREVVKYKDFSNDENLAKYIQGKSFSTWKTQLNHVTDDLDNMKTTWLDLVKKRAKDDKRFPETLLCLLRFIRNLVVHSRDEMKEINVMKLFPELVVTAYKCAKERDWEVKGFLPLASAGKRKADSSFPTQGEGQEPDAPPQRRMRRESRAPLKRISSPWKRLDMDEQIESCPF